MLSSIIFITSSASAELFCIDFTKLSKAYIITYLNKYKIPFNTISIYSGVHEKNENENDIIETKKFIGCKLSNTNILLASYTPIQVGYVKKSIVLYYPAVSYNYLKDAIVREVKVPFTVMDKNNYKHAIEWELHKANIIYNIKLYIEKVPEYQNSIAVVDLSVR